MEGSPPCFEAVSLPRNRPIPLRAQVLGFPAVPVLRVTWDELLLNTPFGGLRGLNWELRWFNMRWIVQDGRANNLYTDFPLRTPMPDTGPNYTTYRATWPDIQARSDGTYAPRFDDFPVDP